MVRNLISAALCLLAITSCSKDPAKQLLQKSTIRQIDISEIVPIHASSLQYFDFVIRFTDNTGRLQTDTVREGSSLSRDCYIKTFSYRECSVACTAIVELIPKVPGDEVVSFIFINPKPYLMPIILSSSPVTDSRGSSLPEGYEDIPISSMRIDEFMSTYGTIFSSSCRISEDYNGPKIISY